MEKSNVDRLSQWGPQYISWNLTSSIYIKYGWDKCSIFLGLDSLTKLRALLGVGSDTISQPHIKWNLPLLRKYGHLHLEWSMQIMFTVKGPNKVHRDSFHTQPGCKFQLLRWSDPNGVTAGEFKNLQRITEECDVCQWFANAPSRFRVAFIHVGRVFIRSLSVSLTRIDGKQYSTL